jgi:hypothetical protein
VFLLDDEDRALVGQRRGEHMRLGFALQSVTVRRLGTFLEDPLDVPGAALEFVADQLGVEVPSQVKRYTERRARTAAPPCAANGRTILSLALQESTASSTGGDQYVHDRAGPVDRTR